MINSMRSPSFGQVIYNHSVDRCLSMNQRNDLAMAVSSLSDQLDELDKKGLDITIYGVPGTGQTEYAIRSHKKGELTRPFSSGWSDPQSMIQAAIETAQRFIDKIS